MEEDLLPVLGFTGRTILGWASYRAELSRFCSYISKNNLKNKSNFGFLQLVLN